MPLPDISHPGVFQSLAPFLTNQDCAQSASTHQAMATQIRGVYHEAVSKNEEGALQAERAQPLEKREDCGGNSNAAALSAALFVVEKLGTNRDPLKELTPKTLMQEALPKALGQKPFEKIISELEARKPDYDLIHVLLFKNPEEISMEERGTLLKKSPNAILTKMILRSGPISIEDRGIATYRAADENDLARVRTLLKPGPILKTQLSIAIKNATPHKNKALMRALGAELQPSPMRPPELPRGPDLCICM